MTVACPVAGRRPLCPRGPCRDVPQLSWTQRQTDRYCIYSASWVGWKTGRHPHSTPHYPWGGRVGGEGPESLIPRQGTPGPLRAGVAGNEHQGESLPPMCGARVRAGLWGVGRGRKP